MNGQTWFLYEFDALLLQQYDDFCIDSNKNSPILYEILLDFNPILRREGNYCCPLT